MPLDLARFFAASNPSNTLQFKKESDRQYYVDCSSVRTDDVAKKFRRVITLSPNKPTCQFMAGPVGSGKSTELFRLKTELEQQSFYVIYFEVSDDLDLNDVNTIDILLAIAHRLNQTLEAIGIQQEPRVLTSVFNELARSLGTVEPLTGKTVAQLISKISSAIKDQIKLRQQFRQHAEPHLTQIVQAINEELIAIAIEALKQQGKKGLVILADNLDRMALQQSHNGRSPADHALVHEIFHEGSHLRKLNCHSLYTVPLQFAYAPNLSNEQDLSGSSNISVTLLPMVPLQHRNGSDYPQGLDLLRQIVLSRAFPEISSEARLQNLPEVFDSLETLDRLCLISGGHIRHMLGLLYGCLQQDDPPISRFTLDLTIINDRRHRLTALTEQDYQLLRRVYKGQYQTERPNFLTLLKNMLIFEYQDEAGRWFALNPMLNDTEISF